MNYRDIPRPGQSALKRCYADPALFFETDIAKTRPQKPATEQQIFGMDVEDYLLWGAIQNVVIIPEDVLTKNGSRSGNAWDEWAATVPPGQRVMKSKAVKPLQEKLKCIKQNVQEQAVANQLVYGMEAELKVPVLWQYCEVALKSEIDVLHPDRIVDIKTAADVSPRKFCSAICNYGYDIQGAAYQLAVEQHTGKLLPFDFVVIQNEPSFQVETYRLSEDFLEVGRKKLIRLCEFYRACVEHDEWRSETHGRLFEIEPPAWLKYEEQWQT